MSYLVKFIYLIGHRNAVFSLHPIRWHVITISGNVNLDHLTKGVSVRFFYYKAIHFPFVINMHFVRMYFETMYISFLIKLLPLSIDVS